MSAWSGRGYRVRYRNRNHNRKRSFTCKYRFENDRSKGWRLGLERYACRAEPLVQLIHLARHLGRAVDPRARDEALVLEDAEHGGRRGLQVPERGGERGRVHARGVGGGEDCDVPCPDGGEVGLCGTGVSWRGWDGLCNRWKGGREEERERDVLRRTSGTRAR